MSGPGAYFTRNTGPHRRLLWFDHSIFLQEHSMNKVLLTLASALVVVASGSGPVRAGTPLPSTIAWPTSPIMQAAQSVGSLPGGGSVDPSGQYRYSLPIDVPPGPAGLQPSLSVT